MCGLADGLGLVFADDFFFFAGVGVGVSSSDSDAFFSDGEAGGDLCADGEGFGLVFFLGEGDGELLCFLWGVGVGVAKAFFTLSAKDSWAPTLTAERPRTSGRTNNRESA